MSKKLSTKNRLAKLAAKPHSDTVRPLGTKREKKIANRKDIESPFAHGKDNIPETKESDVQSPLAIADTIVVDSTQSPNADIYNKETNAVNPREATQETRNIAPDVPQHEEGNTTMTLTFKGLSKSGKFALYSGLRTVTRLSVTDFKDSKPLPSFEATGDFAGPREAKPKMTAEERKAYRLAHPKPKPTLAELIAKREKALAALKAKAEAQGELVAQ